MRIKSYGSVTVFEPEQESVNRELNRFVSALKQKVEIRFVWLIGSYHRGDFGPFSDLDLVIGISASSERFLDRASRFYPEKFLVPMDIFVYTDQEICEMEDSQHSFWNHIRTNHTVLFERE